MTAIPDTPDFGAQARAAIARTEEPGPRIKLDETYWGYILRPTDTSSASLVLMQASASFLGAAFAAAAIGIWMFSGALLDTSMVAIKFVISGGLAMMSSLLLYFASRGDQVEIQVDTSLGEIREVVRNRAGRPTLMGRYGFDAMESAFLDRPRRRKGEEIAWLSVKFRDSSQTVGLARGPVSQLETLCRRIETDLMVGSRKAARYDAVMPLEISRPPEAA